MLNSVIGIVLIKLGKRKRTIIISERLDGEIKVYIRERAIDIISKGGNIPSESQLFEELLTKGLRADSEGSYRTSAVRTNGSPRKARPGNTFRTADESKPPDIAI